jgi:glyoxylase-like metal-dependent hydrolase (beta-lactamase superfamily II)
MDDPDIAPILTISLTLSYGFHALRDGDRLFLIDTGMIGGWWFLERTLAKRGWAGLPIEGIVLTHGHIDHAHNAQFIKERTGAWIAAPARDQEHLLGVYPYRGIARVCGWLEGIGRRLLSYRPPEVDQWVEEGDELPIWEGLHAVHLPGHTIGHMGYHCPARGLAFCGDLFASYWMRSYWPPAIFNTRPELLEPSRQKLLRLQPERVYPCHNDGADGATHLRRLKRLPRRRSGPVNS